MDAGEQDSYPGDHAARTVLVLLPLLAAGLTAWSARSILHQKSGLPVEWAGVAIAAAALLAAALLGAFSLLGQWRSRMNERAMRDSTTGAREWPVRALIDESVAAALVGVLDSALIMALALLGSITSGWAALASTALLVGVGLHMGLLFILIVVCLYSAYTQSESVPKALDGHM
ncbi:hypothetical protein ACSDQ9_05815 [Aestuariimicrobium soli]|uniref:hypothetical protein n=1 Tax=Aestuariimicrobium soli TaxID=2035834 RepID=UPI003EBAE084